MLCVAILSGGGARAEGFIDVYLGGSYTDDATTRYSSMASATTKFEDSTIGGVRGGVWIGPWPWLGFAGDISYFRADHDARRADIHVIPLSLLVMLRVPIFRSEFDAKWDDANVTIKGDIETDHFQMGVGFHF